MNIYLIKLILILVFNIGINTYYINSGCKCCCGNSKSGEIGGGSKGNLGTNPPKGPKTPVKTHTTVKQPEELKPTKGAHIGGMKSGEGNDLEGEKALLTKKLNQLIVENDALGAKKIDINIDAKAISSLKDQDGFNDMNKKIEELIKEYNNKNIATLRAGCLSKLNECIKLNNNLLEKENLNEFSEESIQNEMDIDKLNEINDKLSAIKEEISKKREDQDNLVSYVKNKNEDLKNLIGNFYENEILETPFDAKINNAKLLSELEDIKKELDYILGQVFVDKRIKYENMGVRDYEVIYYDKLENDLKNDNIYRIMQIMNTFIYRASRELAVNLFLLYKNKTDLVNPFGEEGYSENVFNFFYYLFLKSDSFRNAFKSLLENISGNSFFANSLKSIFYVLDNGIHRYDLKKSNVEFSEAVLILESKKAKKIKDFLDKNGIKLGEQKEESKLRSIKSLSIEILNEKVYEDARRVIAYKNYKASKAKDNK